MKRLNLIAAAAAVVLLALAAMPAQAQGPGVMFIKNNNVGIYTDDPKFPLHVVRTAAGAQQMVRLVNNGAPFFVYEDTSNNTKWALQPTQQGKFTIALLGSPGAEFLIDKSGNVMIKGTLKTGGGGTCDPGPCDGVFDPEQYTVESIDEHAAYMWENKHLWGVGPTPEGEPLNLSKKTTGILHELEKAHIYIEQLHKRIEALEAKLK